MGTYTPAVIEAGSPCETTSTRKRQRRSLDLKRQSASVTRVARAHGVNANQVFHWRHLYEQGRLGNVAVTDAARLLPVSVADATVNGTAASAVATELPTPSGGKQAGKAGSINLELRKARVHIEGDVDPAVLRLVLQAVLR